MRKDQIKEIVNSQGVNSKEIKNGFGVVYLIMFEDESLKIGRTKKPIERLKTIQHSSGKIINKLFLSEACSNYIELETKVIKEFNNDTLEGGFLIGDFKKIKGFIKKQEKEKMEKEEQDFDCEGKVGKFLSGLEKDNLYPDVHRGCCFVPLDDFEYMLKSYKKDKSCDLIFDFKDYIFENEKSKFNKRELVEFLKTKESERQEVESFEETTEELIQLFVDNGLLEKKENTFEKRGDWYC